MKALNPMNAIGDVTSYSGDDLVKAIAVDSGGAVLSAGSNLLIGGSNGMSFTISLGANVAISIFADKYKAENLKTDDQKRQ